MYKSYRHNKLNIVVEKREWTSDYFFGWMKLPSFLLEDSKDWSPIKNEHTDKWMYLTTEREEWVISYTVNIDLRFRRMENALWFKKFVEAYGKIHQRTFKNDNAQRKNKSFTVALNENELQAMECMSIISAKSRLFNFSSKVLAERAIKEIGDEMKRVFERF